MRARRDVAGSPFPVGVGERNRPQPLASLRARGIRFHPLLKGSAGETRYCQHISSGPLVGYLKYFYFPKVEVVVVFTCSYSE